MRMSLIVLVLVLGTAACGGGSAGDPGQSKDSSWKLRLEPASPLDHAQPVVAFVLASETPQEPPADSILVQGEPSKASIGRYVAGETPAVLAEQIVATGLDSRPGRLVIRPQGVLALGQRYTVLSRSGVLGSVVVSPTSELTYLARVWPPQESTEATMQTIYCGDSAPKESAALLLQPGDLAARLEPGLDPQGHAIGNCVRILPTDAAGQRVQPPTHLLDFAIEPSPWLAGVDLPEISALTCTAGESNLGPGCLAIDNGIGVVRGPASRTLWVFSSSLGWHLRAVEGGGRFTVPLSEQMRDEQLDVLVFDLAGRSLSASVRIVLPEPAARVVINEVMANPLGPEPAEEWVEVSNAGSIAASMVGWRLRDEAGEVDLPPLLLEPSAVVLFVRNDFLGGRDGDVPPALGTALVRLPSLGRNGLSNSGEALALIDASGATVSAFPAQASERAGVSIARRSPLELDDAIDGFAPHANPGASPGTSNIVQ
jgi:hypothetical protein